MSEATDNILLDAHSFLYCLFWPDLYIRMYCSSTAYYYIGSDHSSIFQAAVVTYCCAVIDDATRYICVLSDRHIIENIG